METNETLDMWDTDIERSFLFIQLKLRKTGQEESTQVLRHVLFVDFDLDIKVSPFTNLFL